MLQPRHRWIPPASPAVDPDLRVAAAARGLSGRLTNVLAARGVTSAEDLDAWLAEPVAGLHDPRLLPDAGLLADRIAGARDRGERVMVFGDFDADGLTGLAILVLAFRRLGLDVVAYVPSRLDEGHGLSRAAVAQAAESGASLIVTVDCGSTSGAEIEEANRAGVDVIVTDHHRVPPELPPAVAVVNPHRTDSAYPDRRLAGSGVAFKVANLVLADELGGPEFAASLADLATIGTVADVAPIVGENRSIARLGLDLLRANARPGIRALLARANIPSSSVDLETIGYAIAPRLNAAGRVGEAADAARLLVADDDAEAAELAGRLDAANTSRRDLMRTALAEARVIVGEDPPPAILIRGPWPVGIVGLIAGRLADELRRPAVVGADLGEVIRASCRSNGALDLGEALEACSDLLVRHGGHAGAAGFEIAPDRWDAFRARFLALSAVLPRPDPRPELRLDLVLPAAEVGYALLRDLAAVAPCGPGNPEPVVAMLDLTVVRARAANGGHSQVVLRRERDVLDGIAFDWPELASLVSEGDRIDVVGRLVSRSFAGLETLQIEVRDAAPAGSQALVAFEADDLLAGVGA